MMNATTLLFYAFAALLVFAALRVVTDRNPVHAALYLILSFFSASAGNYYSISSVALGESKIPTSSKSPLQKTYQLFKASFNSPTGASGPKAQYYWPPQPSVSSQA